MILGADGKKLSKRHGATAVGDYQDQGILPAAMRNFLALMGWSPGEDREILEEAEMIRLFSLEGIQKKPAVFDTTKLEWMNSQYLSARPVDELVEPVQRQLGIMGVPITSDLRPLIDSVKARSRTILDIARQVAVRLDPARSTPDDKGQALIHKMGPAFEGNLALASAALESLKPAEWKPEQLLATLKSVAESNKLKLGDVMQPVRVALTGSTVSEPVNELLFVVGPQSSINTLKSTPQRWDQGTKQK
jgi:glutamyl-tRNA synthetase